MGERFEIRGRRGGRGPSALWALAAGLLAALLLGGLPAEGALPIQEMLLPGLTKGAGGEKGAAPAAPAAAAKPANQGELGKAAKILQERAEAEGFFWERGSLLERSDTIIDLKDVEGVRDDLFSLFLMWRGFVGGLSDRYSRLTTGLVFRVVSKSFGSLFLLILCFFLSRWFRRWMAARRERVSEEIADARLRTTALVLYDLAFATVPKLLLLGAVLLAIKVFALESVLQRVAAVLFGGVTVYAFLRVLLRDMVLAPGDAPRPFGISADAADAVRPAALRVLAFCAWTLIPIATFEAYSYRPGFIALLWTVFWVGMVSILLSVTSQEVMHYLLRPLAGQDRAERVLSASARVYRLVLLGLMVFLLILYALGFVNLTRYLIVGFIFSGAIVGAGRGLIRRSKRRITPIFSAGGDLQRRSRMPPEQLRRLALTVSALVRYAIYLGVVVTLMILWGVDVQVIAWILAFLVTPVGSLGGVPLSIANLVKVGVIFSIAWWLSRYVRHLIEVRMDESSTGPGVRNNIAAGVHYIVLALGIIFALKSVGVDFTTLTIFAGVIGIGVGFGLQTIANNLISGIILLLERTVKPADFIEVGDTRGVVQRVTLRSTIVRTLDNISVIVPNSNFVSNTVVNWSHGEERTRGRIPVGVAYGSDTALVRRCLLEAAEAHEEVLKYPEPRVIFTAFGESSLDFELLYWADVPRQIIYVKSDLLFAIDEIFRREGITIPFPQRDLHVRDFGPAGPAMWDRADRADRAADGREGSAAPPPPGASGAAAPPGEEPGREA
ncbi:MAG: mechanosensitive ion channel domain-containing protein [bacterium]